MGHVKPLNWVVLILKLLVGIDWDYLFLWSKLVSFVMKLMNSNGNIVLFMENLARKFQPLCQRAVCLSISLVSHSGWIFECFSRPRISLFLTSSDFQSFWIFALLTSLPAADIYLIIYHILSRHSFNNLDAFVSINHVEFCISNLVYHWSPKFLVTHPINKIFEHMLPNISFINVIMHVCFHSEVYFYIIVCDGLVLSWV